MTLDAGMPASETRAAMRKNNRHPVRRQTAGQGVVSRGCLTSAKNFVSLLCGLLFRVRRNVADRLEIKCRRCRRILVFQASEPQTGLIMPPKETGR